MAKYNVYISASTQKANVGVGQYGTEQDRMMQLSDTVKYYLDSQNGQFDVHRNQKGWSLNQTVADANKSGSAIFIDNHTNAGSSGAEGTVDFYHGPNKGEGFKLAQLVYDNIAPLSPGKDRGILSDLVLYKNGLCVLRKTNMPACLVEHIFHTNNAETTYYLSNMAKFAKAEAQAVCEYFGVDFLDPDAKPDEIEQLVQKMMHDGLITNHDKCYAVLSGKEFAKPDYLKIIFDRATNKIK